MLTCVPQRTTLEVAIGLANSTALACTLPQVRFQLNPCAIYNVTDAGQVREVDGASEQHRLLQAFLLLRCPERF